MKSRRTITRTLTLPVFCGGVLLAATIAGKAQKDKAPAKAPDAPLPPQIQTGSNVFLSNLCSTDPSTCTGIYNELYAGLQKQGKYTLVASPGLADLVFEIHYTTRLTNVTGSEASGPVSFGTTTLQLIILDRTTRTALWSFTEPELRKVRATDKVLADLQQVLSSFRPEASLAPGSPGVSETASGAQTK